MVSSETHARRAVPASCPTDSPLRDRVDVVVRWSQAAAPRGTVLFCHGLGMGADTYVELCEHWADAGFVVVSPSFSDALVEVAAARPELGLDPTDPTGWMTDGDVVSEFLAMMFDPQQWLGRVADATAVADGLAAILTSSGLDPLSVLVERFVVAGHSYGAHTAQIMGGARVDTPGATDVSFRHPRMRGAIVMSPQGSGERGLTHRSWRDLDVPWLVISGEHDTAARGQGVEWRRQTYDLAPPGGRALAVLRGIDHGLGGIGGQSALYVDSDAAVRAVHDLTTRFVAAAAAGIRPDLRTSDPLVLLEEK